MRKHILFMFLIPAAMSATSCSKSLVCGEGSIEVDGECVAQAPVITPQCGAGTTYNELTGQCDSDLLAGDVGRCGPDTVRIIDVDGVPTCLGQGGCNDCSTPPICPPPSTPAQNVTLCGRVFDLETSEPLGDDPMNTDIMTKIKGEAFDPIGFVSNPDLPAIADISFDGCGYFQLEVALPFSNTIGVRIDDADSATDDVYVLTGVAASVSVGETVHLNAFATRASTDVAWTDMASNPVGSDTFFENGVYVPIFVDTNQPAVGPFEGTPTAGVAVAIGIDTLPANDVYFSDTAPLSRSTIDVDQAVTGANGTAVVYNKHGLDSNYTGIGPAGCTWPRDEAGMVARAIFVQVRNGTCD